MAIDTGPAASTPPEPPSDARRRTSDGGCGAGTRAAGASRITEFAPQEGEVVLDVVHRIQATQAPDLAVRWNCKAGKCGLAAPR